MARRITWLFDLVDSVMDAHPTIQLTPGMGDIVAYREAANKLVLGQLTLINHRQAWMKVLGDYQTIIIADWRTALRERQLHVFMRSAPLFQKTIVVKGQYHPWPYWWMRLKARLQRGKWQESDKKLAFDNKLRALLFDRLCELCGGLYLWQHKQLVTGLVCADGIFLPFYGQRKGPLFYFFPRYNHLKNTHPLLWKQWITQNRTAHK